MSKNNVMVFSEMRPPVAALHGETPLRGKHVQKLLDLAQAEHTDSNGQRLNKETIVKNYTDDARLKDVNWNMRHHVTPSHFNKNNHKHYSQYFDKEFKNRQGVLLNPQRQLDPYEENEVKGTRMPDYSKLSKERDIYGELGWISNFNVKFSKNNTKMHPTYREFFDGPKNYHSQFNNASLTNQEFFRQNAPDGSVARLPKGDASLSPQNSSLGFKSNKSAHKRSGTLDASATQNFQGSFYATPFILDKDKSNRHRVADEIKKTMQQSSEIPFLRTQINAMKLSKTHNGTFMGNYIDRDRGLSSGPSGFKAQAERMEQVRQRKLARKELGWNNNIKPISKYNSQVHPSMRIPFEQI